MIGFVWHNRSSRRLPTTGYGILALFSRGPPSPLVLITPFLQGTYPSFWSQPNWLCLAHFCSAAPPGQPSRPAPVRARPGEIGVDCSGPASYLTLETSHLRLSQLASFFQLSTGYFISFSCCVTIVQTHRGNVKENPGICWGRHGRCTVTDSSRLAG